MAMPETANRDQLIPAGTQAAFFPGTYEAVDYSSVVTPEFRQSIIDRYVRWHNLENHDTGAKLGHNTFTDGLYSRHNLPVIATLHEWSKNSRDTEAEKASAKALFMIHAALETLTQYTSQNGFDERTSFARMRAAAINGDPVYPTFLTIMNEARSAAIICLRNHANKVSPNTPISTRETETFADHVRKAQQEYLESQEGVSLGPKFTERLCDAKTKVLIYSLDVNSTLNAAETAANLPFMESVTAELEVLAAHFRKTFPEKQLYIVLNTGRPALYEWAIWETALPAIPEIRALGLAESGGVILRMDGSQLRTKIAVESPHLWQEQLTGLQIHILNKIQNRYDVIIEPKSSMLSVRIAQRTEEGGRYLYATANGSAITEQWIEEQVSEYLDAQHTDSTKKMGEIEKKIREAPTENIIITKTLQKLGLGGGDTIANADQNAQLNILKTLAEAFADATIYRAQELQDLHDKLVIVTLMKQKIKAKFNATAGYVDIGHEDLNKFSTLMRAMKENGVTPPEIVVVHAGDSSTDIMPTDQTGPGAINEGANDVFLVGMQNSSTSLRNAITARGNFGRLTSREQILGLHDLTLGITRTVEDIEHTKKST